MRNIMEQANKYIKNIINTQRTFFNSNKTKDITFRKKMLCKLKKGIMKRKYLEHFITTSESQRLSPICQKSQWSTMK